MRRAKVMQNVPPKIEILHENEMWETRFGRAGLILDLANRRTEEAEARKRRRPALGDSKRRVRVAVARLQTELTKVEGLKASV